MEDESVDVDLTAVFASSEATGHRLAGTLGNHDPAARPVPWLSAASQNQGFKRVFPVELGVEVGSVPTFVTKLELQAHPFCVPTVVKVFVGVERERGDDNDNAARDGAHSDEVSDLLLSSSESDDLDSDVDSSSEFEDLAGGGYEPGCQCFAMPSTRYVLISSCSQMDMKHSQADLLMTFGELQFVRTSNAVDITSNLNVVLEVGGIGCAPGNMSQMLSSQIATPNPTPTVHSAKSWRCECPWHIASGAPLHFTESLFEQLLRPARFLKFMVVNCHKNVWNTQRRAGLQTIVAKGASFTAGTNPTDGLIGAFGYVELRKAIHHWSHALVMVLCAAQYREQKFHHNERVSCDIVAISIFRNIVYSRLCNEITCKLGVHVHSWRRKVPFRTMRYGALLSS